MQRIRVDSSNLSSVGYDEKTETLEVEFHEGSVYIYRGVPVGVYEKLMSWPSIGEFFAIAIRNVYEYEQLS